jgi:hypothetical protein
MFGKASLGVFILAGVLVATPPGQVMAGGSGPTVQGVWTCTVVRAGTIQRPIIYRSSPKSVADPVVMRSDGDGASRWPCGL